MDDADEDDVGAMWQILSSSTRPKPCEGFGKPFPADFILTADCIMSAFIALALGVATAFDTFFHPPG